MGAGVAVVVVLVVALMAFPGVPGWSLLYRDCWRARSPLAASPRLLLPP